MTRGSLIRLNFVLALAVLVMTVTWLGLLVIYALPLRGRFCYMTPATPETALYTPEL